MKRAEIQRIKCYEPDARLRMFLREKLSYQTAMAKKIAASGKNPKLTEEEKIAISKDTSLRSTKSTLLDQIIFPAMANLVFFFEMVNQHCELQEVFDRDIMDLLGINRKVEEEKPAPYADTFVRLIKAMIDVDNSARTETGRDYKNFRLRLMDEIAKIVVFTFQHNLPNTLPLDAQKIMMEDVFKAQVWTHLLARPITDSASQPHRKIIHRVLESRA